MTLHIKDGGVWKDVTSDGLQVKDGGVWKESAEGHIKDSGVWKQFHESAYEIQRSLRFNSSDSAYLSRTPSAGNRKTWTWAGWVKLSTSSAYIFAASSDNWGGNYTTIQFNGTAIRVEGSNPDHDVFTANLFRDYSAWMHLVVALDTTQATAANRIKVYVNGVEAVYSTASYPTQNSDTLVNAAVYHQISGRPAGNFFNGYLTEVHFIDGQALTPSSFGGFDTNGVWQPKAYAGSYGTRGFHLPFSDNSTAAALGTDTSGNGNDWTVNNINSLPSGYTADYAISGTAPTYTPYGTTYGWQTAFDGSLVTGPITYITGYSELDVQNKPSWSSTIRVNIVSYYAGDVSINGIALGINSGGWKDVTSLVGSSGTLNTVRISSVGSNYVRLGAIELDGVILNDGGSVFRGSDVDSLVDSPTNYGTDSGAGGEVVGNYCTLNPLQSFVTLANGNLYASQVTAGHHPAYGTVGVSSGMWYFEFTKNDSASTSNTSIAIGVVGSNFTGINTASAFSTSTAHTAYIQNGTTYYDNETYPATTPNSATCHNAGIWMLAYDFDNGKGWIGKDGVWFSPGATSGGDPANGTNPIFTNFTVGTTYVPILHLYAATSVTVNFGQRPFAYTAPSGFKALCTTNLPEPTIADGSTAMDVKLYTGNGSTQTISGLNFSPDLVWLKSRSSGYGSNLVDTVRGATNRLVSNAAVGEVTVANGLTAFTSDGFSLGSYTETNILTGSMVAWTWDAGSSTVTNNAGSISSQVRANPSAGFSVVTYTGNGTAGATVGHGLGVAPSMLLVKARDGVENWAVYHSSIGATKYLILNATSAEAVTIGRWNNTAPTSTVVSTGDHGSVNTNTTNYVAYCFAPVAGYSAMGSYVGNGIANDGTFVYLGFRPKFVMVKNSSSTADWNIWDSVRDVDNVIDLRLRPSTSESETSLTNVYNNVDFLSNGFKLRGSAGLDSNSSGATYIYAAFAEHPFATSRAR